MTQKPRLLICGDSYMAFDPQGPEYNIDHWATHLQSIVDIDNRAVPGASNTQTHIQLIDAISTYTPDYIVLGFTGSYRLEFDRTLTSIYPDIEFEKQTLHTMYKMHVDVDIEVCRNMFVANSCIELAKSVSPTVYSLNLLESFFASANMARTLKTKLVNNQLSNSLVGHAEFAPNDNNYRTYHVKDKQILKEYARQIIDKLLTVQEK